ncbi:MAG TPA: VUT family protein [Solirubrobacteraceae bacterium]|nr:VUT family protein [Solirubrobacteraceae bacterium]
MILVALWLAAITAANLITAHYGPEASIYVAFALIGLTLVLRDRLHDLWREHRAVKMGALILAGSALAFLVSPDAGRIGLASGLAFAAAETVDALVYHAVRHWAWLERSNVSNFFGAAVDSLVFPTVAFGGFMWAVTVGQFTAKVAGALLFTLVLHRARETAYA